MQVIKGKIEIEESLVNGDHPILFDEVKMHYRGVRHIKIYFDICSVVDVIVALGKNQ